MVKTVLGEVYSCVANVADCERHLFVFVCGAFFGRVISACGPIATPIALIFQLLHLYLGDLHGTTRDVRGLHGLRQVARGSLSVRGFHCVWVRRIV